MDFAVPTDHRVKLKGSEKKDKYLDLARESNKLWNMKVTFIPIVTATEELIKGLEDLKIRGKEKSIKITALLRSARILGKVLETWDLLTIKLQWKTVS